MYLSSIQSMYHKYLLSPFLLWKICSMHVPMPEVSHKNLTMLLLTHRQPVLTMNNRLDEADADHQRYNNNQMTADFSSSMQARQSSSQPTADDDDDDAATATSSSSPQRQSETTSSSIRQRPPPRRVDHTYRDYSNFPLSELPSGKKTPTNFPSKLHQILSTPEYAHVSSFLSPLILYIIYRHTQLIISCSNLLLYTFHNISRC